MKTAISISDELFKTVDDLAAELHVSRSRLFTEAVKEFINKLRNRKILESLNRVYSEAETEEESRVRKQSKKNYAKIIKSEKW